MKPKKLTSHTKMVLLAVVFGILYFVALIGVIIGFIWYVFDMSYRASIIADEKERYYEHETILQGAVDVLRPVLLDMYAKNVEDDFLSGRHLENANWVSQYGEETAESLAVILD
jgi:hypothetical protein